VSVIFRVDSSIQMGVGHVMRCLSLADSLQKEGHSVSFICRKHKGNIIALIEKKGYFVFKLRGSQQVLTSLGSDGYEDLFHAGWLGATQVEDAHECSDYIALKSVDYLIVDHYAIDYRWQMHLKPYCKRLVVIDDLADRKHDCDLLLDQTYARAAKDYLPLVPDDCLLLLGAQYALLRPEFAHWREYSLNRRVKPELERLLITMGGVDPDNVTGDILAVLERCALPKETIITVVVGATAPHLASVKKQVNKMSVLTELKINVSNMAELMANSDLAIGAAGATTWERATVGLPSITLCLAENQKQIAFSLQKQGLAIVITDKRTLTGHLRAVLGDIQQDIDMLSKLSVLSRKITDGSGVWRVVKHLSKGE